MPLGIVVGLAAEARIARHLGAVEIGGGTAAGAEQAARRLVAGGATALLSFGLAGGLDPNLRPGARVVPAMVVEGGRRYPADADLCRALGGVTAGSILGSDHIVGDAAEKRTLSERTGASAVDMESGAVARVAAQHRRPFAVLRAICDPADRSLPHAARLPLAAGGRIAGLQVALSLAVRPWQVPALIRLALDAALARHTLVRSAAALSRSLGD